MGITLTKYSGSESNMVTPDALGLVSSFNRIDTIGSEAFSYATNLKTLTARQKYILNRAFSDRTGITSANLPNCTYLGESAFNGCTALPTISMPNCEEIDENAFTYCTNLTSVAFPKCKKIHAYAFKDAINLQSVSVPNCEYIGEYAFLSCSAFEAYVASYLLTSEYFKLGKVLYKASTTISSFVDNDIVMIAHHAFSGCTNLSYISVPNCKDVGQSAFIGTAWLSALFAASSYATINGGLLVDVLPGNFYWNSCNLSNITKVCNGAFYAGLVSEIVKNVEMPNCTYIAAGAFKNGTYVLSLSFPVCSYIGRSAFYNLSGAYSTVYFPECTYIDNSAFNRASIHLVNFPKCSYIGKSAFCNGGVTKIDLPACKKIDDYGFYWDRFISEVSLPNCTYIGDAAFGTVYSLSTLNLPECSYIGKSAFANGSISSFSLPKCLYVKEFAFSGCYLLRSISLPECLSIDTRAFNSISRLSYIYAPKCKLIGTMAFAGCTSLTTAILDSCTTIRSSAFASLSKLTSINLPHCTFIDESAFYSCSNLSQISAPNCEYLGIDALSRTAWLSALQSTGGLVSLGKCLIFAGSVSGDISWPDYTTLYESAFYNKTSLYTVNLENCSWIHSRCFAYCYSISSALLPKCKSIGNEAFEVCRSLTELSLPECTTIRGAAFYEAGLSKIYAPKCTFIGLSAFKGTKLTSLTLNDFSLVSIIGYNIFDSCSYLSTVESPATILSLSAFANCTALTTASFPLCISIGAAAFSDCSSLLNLYLPVCEKIDGGAFVNTPNIRTWSGINPLAFEDRQGLLVNKKSNYTIAFRPIISQPNLFDSTIDTIGRNTFLSASYPLTVEFTLCQRIELSAFTLCSGLLLASFPVCYSIGDRVFYNCYNLTYGYFPLCSIVNWLTFYACTKLSSIELPNCKFVSTEGFCGCSKLTNINIPSCISLYTSAFNNCWALPSIVLPACTTVSSYAFYNCSSLSSVYMLASSVATLGNINAFLNCSTLTGIYVPLSLVSSYKTAVNWSYYTSIILPTVTPINCKSLSITGDNCMGRDTHTTIHASAICDVRDIFTGEVTENLPWSFDDLSEEFPLNPSTTETVQRTISYTYFDKTATCTITQGVWIPLVYSLEQVGSYGFAIDSTIPNPDSTLYEGVYKSDNYNINNSQAIVKITFDGYENFTVYIRSYAESTYDYTIASTLDATSYPTSSGDSTAKAHTSGTLSSGTALNNYTKVTYETDRNEHFIYIVYIKDGSLHSGYDRGYFLIEK